MFKLLKTKILAYSEELNKQTKKDDAERDRRFRIMRERAFAMQDKTKLLIWIVTGLIAYCSSWLSIFALIFSPELYQVIFISIWLLSFIVIYLAYREFKKSNHAR